jgi:hypothetical protein
MSSITKQKTLTLFIWQVIIFWGASKLQLKNKNEVIFMVFNHHILQKNIE